MDADPCRSAVVALVNPYASVTAKTCARCDRDYYGLYVDHRLSNEHARGIAANKPHSFERVVFGTWCQLCGNREETELHKAVPA